MKKNLTQTDKPTTFVQQLISLPIKTLRIEHTHSSTNKRNFPLHRSIFFASFPQITALILKCQSEVIGSGQMTLARNLNRIAFIAAFVFLAAIVVGLI